VITVLHATVTHEAKETTASGCTDVARFRRLRYYHGRALGAQDLRDEQAYHLHKGRWRNRVFHGWGIVCGLDVDVVPYDDRDCETEEEKRRAMSVVGVGTGAAVDCAGDEIVVRRRREVRLASLIGAEEFERLAGSPATVYLTLCYHEELTEPGRPLVAADCEPLPACEYGAVCETFRICASTTRPDPGPACEPCCGACGSRCLELAAIVDFDPDEELRQEQIDLSGRRRLALHELAEIAGVNWVHGGVYTREDATQLLDEGLEVRFTRPVQVASLQRGVIELTTIEAGGGRAAGMYDVSGQFRDLPSTALTDRFVYRSTTGETLQHGDRVTITIRGDHIVDECCRAIDGNHVAGAVPTLESAAVSPVQEPTRPSCPPRASGNGTEGGDFVSWIFVAERGGAK
jgi:hypothetical protein